MANWLKIIIKSLGNISVFILIFKGDWTFTTPVIGIVLFLLIFTHFYIGLYTLFKTQRFVVNGLALSIGSTFIFLFYSFYSQTKPDWQVELDKNSKTWNTPKYRLTKEPFSKTRYQEVDEFSFKLYEYGFMGLAYKEIDWVTIKDTNCVVEFKKAKVNVNTCQEKLAITPK